MRNDRPPCRVCAAPADLFFEDWRAYYKCPVCYLVFTGETAGREEQDRHYRAQDKDDPAFWRRVAETYVELASQFAAPGRILDFGSGEGRLSEALRDMGYEVESFEPRIHGAFGAREDTGRFGVVVANQVLEHLSEPCADIAMLCGVLEEGGMIFLTSSFTDAFIHSRDAVEQFRSWWFKDDATHISFFCYWTLKWIAERLGLEVIGYGPIAAILRK